MALFGSKSSHKVSKKLQAANVPLGYGLCLMNLAFDGYTNAVQVGESDRRAGGHPHRSV